MEITVSSTGDFGEFRGHNTHLLPLTEDEYDVPGTTPTDSPQENTPMAGLSDKMQPRSRFNIEDQGGNMPSIDNIPKIQDADLKGKIVLIRVDHNVAKHFVVKLPLILKAKP